MTDSATPYILLGFLAHEDLSGYDLRKRVAGSVGRFWDVGYGQIYPALKALERDDLVSSHPGRTGKGPNRIVYRIEEQGRDRLTAWLHVPGEREHLRFEVMLKLFFGSGLPTEENARRVERFRDQHQTDLDTMTNFKRNLESVLDDADHLHFYLTVLFGEKIYKACVEWADEARRLIEANAHQERKA